MSYKINSTRTFVQSVTICHLWLNHNVDAQMAQTGIYLFVLSNKDHCVILHPEQALVLIRNTKRNYYPFLLLQHCDSLSSQLPRLFLLDTCNVEIKKYLKHPQHINCAKSLFFNDRYFGTKLLTNTIWRKESFTIRLRILPVYITDNVW